MLYKLLYITYDLKVIFDITLTLNTLQAMLDRVEAKIVEGGCVAVTAVCYVWTSIIETSRLVVLLCTIF